MAYGDKRPADYVLKVKDKATNITSVVGYGWLKEDKAIGQHVRIYLNLCTTLTRHPDLMLTLFENNRREPAKRKPKAKRKTAKRVVEPDGDYMDKVAHGNAYDERDY